MVADTDKIADLAENSMFFKQGGLFLRIEYCDMDEGYMQLLDEDRGEEYRVNFDEVDLTVDKFYKLVENKPE